MEPINPFLVANFNRMKTFLEQISTTTPRDPPFQLPESRDPDSDHLEAFHLSRMHVLGSAKMDVMKDLRFEEEEMTQAKQNLIVTLSHLTAIQARSRSTPAVYFGT